MPPSTDANIFEDLHIFEMANNHQGSVAHGLRIVEQAARLARKYRIRAAVKLQFRELDSFIHPDARGRDDIKHIPRFESTRLAESEFRQLVEATRQAGLLAVATPFDEPSVGLCARLGVDIIKIASCSATDWPLLEEVSRARKPVIASTGGLSIYDIDNLMTFFSKRVPALALMHCVSLYPTPPQQQSMNFMAKMIRRYPHVTIGYSGHEAPDDFDVVKVAVAKGAKLLERHFGVPAEGVSLNAYSFDPENAGRWIEAAQAARAICGSDEDKHVSQEEYEALLQLQRGVFARRPIAAGETIAREDVYFAMPCADGQLTSGQFGRYRTHYVASRDYAPDAPVFESCEPDSLSLLRGILHDAKGLVYEAGIALGDDVSIEVSHHYGLERFRETGCVLVTSVNREYCNKFLIMLPGQQHPAHRHREKEETFHLLWGDLEVDLDGDIHRLKPGEKLLVERDQLHAFSTRGGCLFAEISTRSMRSDSHYEDASIAAKDPVERKTLVDSW